MKILYYLLTVVFGLIGLLGLLRTIELLTTGRLNPVQIGIAVVFLALGWIFLTKARGK